MVKFGGEVVAAPEVLGPVLAEIASLIGEGWSFAIVHGAGPQAGELQERLGLRPHKVAGRRITDAATLRVMKQALAGEVSIDLVAHALGAGIDAIGLSGVGGRLVAARRMPVASLAEAGGAVVDYGLVGEVASIRAPLVRLLWEAGMVPVINPLGVQADPAGSEPPQVFNINADTVAAEVAAALGVDHLFLVTAVPGVLRDRSDPSSRIPCLRASEVRAHIDDGTIDGGMIPKVLDALEHLGRGIGAVHILAPEPGALRAEALQPGGRGTALVPDPRPNRS